MDSRTRERPPDVILCQSAEGSCAACCGLYNFHERSPAATAARLRARTERVTAAWPDVSALRLVRDEILDEERPDIVSEAILVCPFAGYVDEGRVGCLLHPTRHPRGEDLRDLAVYPREVCAGHFCAPHDWLRAREIALAQCARGETYGRTVTDAGLIKGLIEVIEDVVDLKLDEAWIEKSRAKLARLFDALVEWPYREADSRRFGALKIVDGREARARLSRETRAALGLSAARVRVLDALGTSEAHARAASSHLTALLLELLTRE